jgi:hypothetical protein
MGMRPDDRMGDPRVAVDLRLQRRKGALAAGEVEYRTATVESCRNGSGKASQAAAALANSVSPRLRPNRSGISSA